MRGKDNSRVAQKFFEKLTDFPQNFVWGVNFLISVEGGVRISDPPGCLKFFTEGVRNFNSGGCEEVN